MKNKNKNLQTSNAFLILMLLSFILLASCSNNKEKVIVNYPNGVKEIYSFDENYLIQGLMKRYYPNGNLQSEVPYEDDMKNGLEKEYYEDGSLYKSGGWINGNLMGDLFEYDKHGNLINHKFFTLNEDNCILFERNYNTNGEIIKENGYPPYWLIYNRNTFDINDTIEVVLFVSSSPNFHSIYSIDECLGNECKSIIFNESIINSAKDFLSKTKVYRKVNKHKKEFYWVVKTQIFDSKTNKNSLKRDTLLFNKIDNSPNLSDAQD